jgi:hypothetical protein
MLRKIRLKIPFEVRLISIKHITSKLEHGSEAPQHHHDTSAGGPPLHCSSAMSALLEDDATGDHRPPPSWATLFAAIERRESMACNVE